MRIAALTYTFGTMKQEAGLHHLVMHGFMPEVIVAAPPVELNFRRSHIRIAPNLIPVEKPETMANAYGIPYVETPHNDPRAAETLREHGVDVAVILGARILGRRIIGSAKIGILNMHPGLLPENRGLDNAKWAIALDLPQFVTGHLIDHRIDRGREVFKREVAVTKDDTLMDIHLRLQAVEREVMVECLRRLKEGLRDFPRIGKGCYRQAVPDIIELGLHEEFDSYKARRAP